MLETTKADESAQVTVAKDCPRLLFACDLPPCHLNGGPILMHRLLSGYPMDRLTVACAAGFLPRAADTLLPCRHVPLFQTTGTGPWGLGRIKQLVDVAAFGPMVWSLERLLRETQSEAVLTVAHGTMFIAAVLAAKRAGKPSVVVVHDDWLWFIGHHSWIPRAVAPVIFGRTLRRATHVYAVSDGVQRWLREQFHVDSEVQLPCADSSAFPRTSPHDDGMFRIVYTGGFNDSIAPGLDLLVEALRQGAIGENWSLDLYGPLPAHAASRGWNDAPVTVHGWRPQPEVHAAMAGADLLFVPLGFDALARQLSNRGFASKMADYLAARRPVLVCSPPESSVSRYVRQWDCAELVDEPSPRAMGLALHRLATSRERRRDLVERGQETFRINHDVNRQRAELLALFRRLRRPG
jgi:glycosyltransferase involved in cell wall biosynthesis